MSIYETETGGGDMFTLVDEQPQNAVIKSIRLWRWWRQRC